MSVPHGAPLSNGAVPTHSSEPIPISGEGMGEGMGEGIGETLARLADRLAVVAVAAHVMERRHPSDVYARSIARASGELARDMRETVQRARDGAPLRAPRIVDASPPDASPDAPPAPPPATSPTVRKMKIARTSTATASERAGSSRRSTRQKTARQHARQTPPEARSAAYERGERPTRSPAPTPSGEPVRLSGDVSGVKGGAQ